ncbi:MAG: EamA family transporter [Erythrobacter sp.]
MSDRSLSSSHLAPFLAAAAGVACLSLMDALMKGASLASGVYTATVLRSLIGAALIAPFWLWKRPSWPVWPVMKLHLERGVVSAFMAFSFFYALTKLPLAEAIALSFIAPLIALYLARVLLQETVSKRAVIASVLGVAGTLVILAGRLGRGEFTEDALLGLAALAFSALLYAYNFIVIRRQSQVAGPVEIATFHSGVGGLVLLVFAPFAWRNPQIETLGAIAASGMLTVAGAMAIAWAYARAQAQALVPIEYSGFVWASMLGWAFFREPVSAPTIAGAVLIVTGCWLAARREPARPVAPTP